MWLGLLTNFVLLAVALACTQVLLVSSAIGVVAATWFGRCADNELRLRAMVMKGVCHAR